jgi:redox-sensitive bicupin YhaK (pirin superfamily)
MKTEIHKANTRGHANHGWLDTHHSFSFASWYNQERMHFGMLRVLNDDIVAGGKGFGTHPHDNMEIISIPLSGDLEHKDSMGTTSVIRENDIQVMSAGTGVLHSEYNKNADQDVNFLQIWIFPKVRNIAPRYDQKSYDPKDSVGKILRLVSPLEDSSDTVKINQDAYISLTTLEDESELSYKLNKDGNGVYAFILEGQADIAGNSLSEKDAVAISEADSFSIETKSHTRILLIEVPLTR